MLRVKLGGKRIWKARDDANDTDSRQSFSGLVPQSFQSRDGSCQMNDYDVKKLLQSGLLCNALN
jgi:hypothetical protein